VDNPLLFGGRDERVPPKAESEGHACHARGIGMDCQTWRSGPDKRVPPSGPDKRVPPKVAETQPPLHPPARGGKAISLPACGEGRGGADLTSRSLQG